MARCIFHLPLRIDPHRASASHIRPQKMLHAFERLGYEVDVVWGTVNERREAIRQIERNIQDGIRYDFLYSESSTMPTLLTEPDHVPRHPTTDFGLFALCRKEGIPTGLFYRDYYWLFPEYKAIGKAKAGVARIFYRYDLRRYRELLDVLFLPSLESAALLGERVAGLRVDELPPGCDPQEERLAVRRQHIAELETCSSDRPLCLFYVGGIGDHYKFFELMGAVSDTPQVRLRMCVRPADWESVRPRYERYVSSGSIEIVHASGEGLNEHLDWADVGNLYFDENDYRTAAIPYKTFEYLGCGLPNLTSDDTAYGRFSAEEGIGFAVGREPGALAATLANLVQDPGLIAKTSRRCIDAIAQNTWEKRAEHVAQTLTGRAGGGDR